jgi:xylulokinase
MANQEFILTLDVGTTSVKTCLFDRQLHLASFSAVEYRLETPRPEIVELDAWQYWQACADGIRGVLRNSSVNPQSVRGLSLATQGETLIPVDEKGTPLHPAIVWLDTRGAAETADLAKRFNKDEYYAHTGLPEIGPIDPVAKILWIKNHRPELCTATHKFLLLKDFLLYRLTGRFLTEGSISSSTGYYDIVRDCWWEEMLASIGIPADRFPDIVPSGSRAGHLTKAAASELGLPESVLVTTGTMDQIAAAIAAGNTKPGILSETTGTALIVAAATDSPDFTSPHRITLYRHYRPGLFLYIPYCPTAGMVLKWFKDEFCPMEQAEAARTSRSVYPILDELAGGVPAGAEGVLVFPHFAGMLSPETDSAARGVFFGLTLQTHKAHLVRAVLESVGYMLRENMELLEKSGIVIREIHSMGGGATSPLWNSIKADITGKTIVVETQQESASLGAAMLGAVEAGWYKDVQTIVMETTQRKNSFTPNKAHRLVYEKSYRGYKSLYTRLKPLFAELQP